MKRKSAKACGNNYSDGPGTPSSERKNSRHSWNVKDNDKVMGQPLEGLLG